MKKVLLYLVLVMAIGMAATVAYVSVSGLIKVFAGAGTVGLILFSIIEGGKIVATSAIHTYGKKIGLFYNIVLSIFIFISMIITSMGIYGFLSSSYKETFAKLEGINNKIELLEDKKLGLQEQLTNVNMEKESITKTINELSKGLSNNVIQYKDKETGKIITTTSSSTRRALEKQLDKATIRQDALTIKSDDLTQKVFDLGNEILEVKTSDESSSELGPLKYLSDVTGMSMDDVMKYFILLLIVIGDPMAIVMIIIFNKIINHDKDDTNPIIEGPEPDYPEPIKSEDIPNGGNIVAEPGFSGTDMEVLKSKGLGPFSEYNQIMGKLWDKKNKPNELIDEEDTDFKNNNILGFSPEEIKANEELRKEECDADQLNKVEDEINKPKVFVAKLKNDAVNDTVNDTVNDAVNDAVNDTPNDSIDRGFSVNVPIRPKPKSTNSIGRIGSNKEIRNGNNNTIIFKKR